MFQCPICEQNTNIPVGGASVLPQNLHLGFEVEVAGYMSKMVNNSHPQEGPDHFPHSKPTQHISVSVKTDDLVTQLSKLGEIIVFFPSPSSSTWMSTSVARVGTRYHVKVQSKTSKGEEYPHGGVEVKGEMRSKTHNGAVVYGEVEDHRDGTYTITLTPQTAGPHQLLITMDGQHVQNSPHDLDVRPKRDYRTLCNDQQVIQCKAPFCVAIHDNGDIYVGSDDHCIYMFDQTGHLKNTIGSSGSGDGQFSSPYGIFIKGDVLYVADYGNHRVQKLTSSGKFLHKFGQQGSGQGQFNGPVGVIIDSNNKLIVSDFNNHRIQIFNENGGWLLTIDGNGTGNHSFQYPWGLALDPQGNIHVAAHGSNTIVFSKEGVYVRMYGDPNGPRGLAIDGEGYSLVRVGGVMVECEDDTLASYSENEKEMEKAERAVEWKMAKKRKLHDVRCVSYTVPATVLRSRAESTTKKYLGAYQRWRPWADARQGVPYFQVQGASSGAVRVAPHNGRVPCVSNEIRDCIDNQTCHNHQFEQSASQNGLRWTLDSAINMLTFQPAADDMDNMVLALGQKKTILKQSKDLEDLKHYSTIVRTKDLDSSLMVVSDSSEAVTLLLSNQIVAFLNKNTSSVEYIHLSDLHTGAARDSDDAESVADKEPQKWLQFSYRVPLYGGGDGMTPSSVPLYGGGGGMTPSSVPLYDGGGDSMTPSSVPLYGGGDSMTPSSMPLYGGVVSYPDPDSHSCGWITSPLFPRSGDVIHPQLWETGSGYETNGGGGGMTPSSVPLYGGGGGMTPSSVPLYGGGDGMTPSSVPRYGGGGGMTPSSVSLYGAGGGMTPSSVPLYGGGSGMTPSSVPRYGGGGGMTPSSVSLYGAGGGMTPSSVPLYGAGGGMTPSSVPLYGGGGGMTPSSVPLYGGGDGMTPSSVPLYGGGGGMTPSSVPLYGGGDGMTPSSVPLYGGGDGMTPSSVPLYGGGGGMTPSSVPLYGGGDGMTPSSVPLYGGGGGMTPSSVPLYGGGDVTSAQDPQSFVQFALSLLDHVKSIRLGREGKEKVQKGRLKVTQNLEKLQHSQRQEQRKEDKKKAEKVKMLNEPDPEKTRKWEEKEHLEEDGTQNEADENKGLNCYIFCLCYT
eukprot:Em0004g809a